MKNCEKTVRKYTKMYRAALKENGFKNIDEKARDYAVALKKAYSSEAFKTHDVYPTVDMAKVYAVIFMCLQLKSFGVGRDDALRIVNTGFKRIKKLLRRIEKIIDVSPFAWKIAKKWNMNEYAARLKDKSISFDYFSADDDKISYKIRKCAYVDVFSYYGIREYCKIFCNTDCEAYSNLSRHIRFIRHSDLSDGESCHDEIIKKYENEK